ncbi:MAG: hypothetical protein V3W19_01610 [Desulfatiglandales bacterium]
MVENEYTCETFRSEISKFDKNFADYLIIKGKEDWNVKNCTFFRDDNKMKKWASCLFERKT